MLHCQLLRVRIIFLKKLGVASMVNIVVLCSSNGSYRQHLLLGCVQSSPHCGTQIRMCESNSWPPIVQLLSNLRTMVELSKTAVRKGKCAQYSMFFFVVSINYVGFCPCAEQCSRTFQSRAVQTEAPPAHTIQHLTKHTESESPQFAFVYHESDFVKSTAERFVISGFLLNSWALVVAVGSLHLFESSLYQQFLATSCMASFIFYFYFKKRRLAR